MRRVSLTSTYRMVRSLVLFEQNTVFDGNDTTVAVDVKQRLSQEDAVDFIRDGLLK